MTINKLVEWLEEINLYMYKQFTNSDKKDSSYFNRLIRNNNETKKYIKYQYPPIAVLAKNKGYFIHQMYFDYIKNVYVIEISNCICFEQVEHSDYYKAEEMAREFLNK
jgi:hypothetical protein